MKVAILCGGLGTRMKEETEFRPKPLVRIGGMPMLWHIMNIYAKYGFNDFVLCLGYKGDMIKEYFMNYEWMSNDFTMNLTNKNSIQLHKACEDWNITFVDTGLETNTGGRIKQIEKYIDDDGCFATYGDGLSDLNINKLLDFHKKKKACATLTGVHPISRYGVLEIGDDDKVTGFKEKPRLDGWINAGFFAFNKEFFDYLGKDDILEKKPLERVAADKKLSVFKHTGFWACMDTFKDAQYLNTLWDSGKAAWKVWD